MFKMVILCYVYHTTISKLSIKKNITALKNKVHEGISLVVQWLRLFVPSAGVQVTSLVRELDPTCHN